METKLAFSFFLIFAVFSSKLATNEKKHIKTLQNFQQREERLQMREESLQKRQEIITIAEVRLAAEEYKLQKQEEKSNRREETLQKREESVKLAEDKLQTQKDQTNGLVQKENLNNFNFNHIISQELFPSLEKTKKMKIKKVKFTGPLNIYPNESSIKVFRDMETDEISWEDPKYLYEMEIKAKIGSCLRQKENEMSNGLFDCISEWFKVSHEAKPFVQKLMYAMAEHVDIDKRGNFMKTPLRYAAELDAVKAVVKLVERGAKTEAVDANGYTSLHVATIYGNEASCRVLLKNGAKVDPQNKYGETPLMYAAQDGRVKIVKLLLHFGADPKIKNGNGKTALQLARDNCANLIEAHEAKLKN